MIHSEIAGQVVLVTGAAGFIGSHLCRRLEMCGADLYAVARNLRDPEQMSRIHWLEGDLSQITIVRDLLATVRPALIVHLASHVSGARSLEVVLPTFHDNLLTTINLLTVAAEIRCRRLVLAGSLEEPAPAALEVVPSSPYAAAKWASSAYARMFHTLFASPVVIARLFMVYGPGQRDLRKLIPYVTTSLLKHQPLILTSGTRLVDWIYIDDAIDGLIAAIETPDIAGRTLDFGSGQLVSVRSVVEQLVELLDPTAAPQFGSVTERPFEQIRVADVSQTRQAVGWTPRINLLDGLKKTVTWYSEQLTGGLSPLGGE
jgi:UDP-glucose 4-epimerase